MGEIETRLARLEARLDSVLPTLATRDELKTSIAEAKSAIIMWLSGAIFAATAIIITTVGLIVNRVSPIQGAAQPPIVVYPVAPSKGP